MPSNLAQARRNRYGARNTNDGAAEDSPSQYYNANGSRSGARINGAVRRKTMMGGSSSGPISMRANRSESMEKEAEMMMENERRKGEERARRTSGQRPDNGVDVTPGTAAKPAGMLIPGSAPGSSIWVGNDDPRLKPPGTGSSSASPADQKALLNARRKRNLKAYQDRKFSRQRADVERNPEQYGSTTVKAVTTTGDGGMAMFREAARKRGELNPPPSFKY